MTPQRKMKIPFEYIWWDTASRVVAEFGENQLLGSYRNDIWYCWQTTWLRGTRPSHSFCPQWADRAGNFLNVIAPWLMYLYLWSVSVAVCRSYYWKI